MVVLPLLNSPNLPGSWLQTTFSFIHPLILEKYLKSSPLRGICSPCCTPSPPPPPPPPSHPQLLVVPEALTPTFSPLCLALELLALTPHFVHCVCHQSCCHRSRVSEMAIVRRSTSTKQHLCAPPRSCHLPYCAPSAPQTPNQTITPHAG